MTSLPEREPASVPGDFYVENACCISCGVPQAVAPDLVDWVDGDRTRCHWKKQPKTAAEFEQAFAVFDGQEAGCHRYAGRNPNIQRRIGYDNCDQAPTLFSTFAPLRPVELQLLAPEQPSLLRKLWTKLLHR